jgi:hypothetical protein
MESSAALDSIQLFEPDAKLVLILAGQVPADKRSLKLGQAFTAGIGLLSRRVAKHWVGGREPPANRHQQLTVSDFSRQDFV